MAVEGTRNENIIRAKLLAQKKKVDGYIIYVFENQDPNSKPETSILTSKYVVCTRFPKWDCPDLKIGDEGFLKFRFVIGGVDTWYDSKLETNIKYKYTDVHFLDFIYICEEKEDIIL